MPTTTHKSRRRHPPRRRARRRRRRRLSLPLMAGLGGALVLLAVMIAVILTHGRAPGSSSPLLPSSLQAEGFSTDENGVVSYSDGDITALQGIDVSSHQGDIDWTAVAGEGIQFALVRAGWRGYTEGAVNADEKCTYNLDQAKENGLLVGAYFYSQAITEEEAQEEARLVLDTIQGRQLDFPIYYDWEPVLEEEARTDELTQEALSACANAFCAVIEAAGYEAGVYFNTSIANDNYILEEISQHDFWLAEMGDIPTFPHRFSFWQYTFSGRVAGIDTYVDRDLYFPPAEDSEEAKET